jgi:hypothetical protein
MIKELTKPKTEILTNENSIRYGWGNSDLKTWFITEHKKQLVPKGSKLLFVITGEICNEPLHTSNTFPNRGDVISDVNGSNIKVTNVEYI